MSGETTQHRAALERVLTRLENVTGREATVSGGQYKTLCPAHADRTPSLSVTWDDGAVMVYCYAGCTQGAGGHNDPSSITDALSLELRDLYDESERDTQRRASVTHLSSRSRQSDRYAVAAEYRPRTVDSPESGEPTGEPRITCWHLYQDPESEDVTWAALRIETPTEQGYRKEFRYAHRDPDKQRSYLKLHNPLANSSTRVSLPDGWAAGAHQDKTIRALYRLTAVRSAVAAGQPVYLVEGESDADAATFAGVAATTAPMGANSWMPQYTRDLAGAHVVLVLDCDDPGIKRGEQLVRTLTGTVASLQVVQPRAGKDVRDHLTAGHALDELTEVDLGIRVPQTSSRDSAPQPAPPSEPARSNAPTPDFGDDGAPNERPEFLVRQGELVERTWERTGRGEEAVYTPRYKTVLGCVASVTEITQENHGDEQDARYARPTRDVTLHLERHDATGTPTEQCDVRMPIKDLRTGDWLDEWPWPDTILSRRKSDREKAHSALYQAIPAPSHRTQVYVTTGWRHDDTGAYFVHGGGAIGRGGSLDIDVDVDPVLARTALPEPTADPATLREAYWQGTDPLRQLPDRIMAPLRGMQFRSLLGRMEMVTNVAGVRATAKTAVCRLMIQHSAPELRFSRGVKEMVSGASHLSSTKGMARMLGRAKDIPLLVDDLAPDRGGASEARVRLGELARKVYNGSAEVKAHYEAGRIVTEHPPRCSLLTTGEILAEGSGGSRCFNLHVEPGQITSNQVAELETKDKVDARGLLGSSFLMWVAGRYNDLMAWTEDLSGHYLAAWNHTLRDVPGDRSRLAEAARDYSLGELAFLRFLLDRGAITDSEADELWRWSVEGIRQAACVSTADTSDPAINLLGYVKDALVTGRAHLTDRKGGVPEDPQDPDAPARYGYTPQQRASSSMQHPEVTTTWHANGAKIGAVDGDRVYLIPSETEYLGRSQAQRVERPWTETTTSLAATLDSHGWLATHTDPVTGKVSRSVGRSLHGGVVRVWDLPRALLDGEHNAPQQPEQTAEIDTRLRRLPEWGELPTLDDTQVSQQDDALPTAVGAEPDAPSSSVPQPEPVSERPILQAVAGDQAVIDDVVDTTAQATPEDAAENTDTTPGSPPPAASQTSVPRQQATEQEWTYKLAVLDTDAIYLPEQDGQITTLPLPEPPSGADIAAWGEALGLRHGRSGLGQLWITPRLSDHLGLTAGTDADLAAKVTDLGLDNSKLDQHQKANRGIFALLTDNSGPFLEDLSREGWRIDPDRQSGQVVIKPFLTVRKQMSSDDGSTYERALELVLAGYIDCWDNGSGPTTIAAMPDADAESAAYAAELARRVGRLAETMQVPWRNTSGATGAGLMDSLRVRDREHDWRKEGASPMPELEHLRGQRAIEGPMHWHQVPSREQLDKARYLYTFDGRAAFLSRAASMDLGVGDPQYVAGQDAQDLVRAKKVPYGIYRMKLPMWDVASLPAPHPEMSSEQGTERWVMSPTVRLLSEIMHKYTQFDLSDVTILEAWIWPQQARALGEWAKRVRTGLLHARSQHDAARQAVQQAGDADRDTWQREVNSWEAVAALTKGLYTGYFGRLDSVRTLHAAEAYRHHHRPHWYHAIKAESRAQDWLKLARHGAATGIYPIAAAGTDSYYYLSSSDDPSTVEPQPDDGKLGKLRVKHCLELTDEARELLAAGHSAAALPGQLARRARRTDGGQA